jgi:hypothetical protein
MTEILVDVPKMEEYLNENSPQTQTVECPLEEHFAPDIYVRQLTMPAGTFVLGATHLTEHLNVVISGSARVVMGDEIVEIKAPCTFKSEAGVQKILHITEDCIWQTVHSNPENITDTEVLSARLVDYTNTKVPIESVNKLLCPSLPQH